ncbi:unnamed protein product [Gadus morhua 'NCC']
MNEALSWPHLEWRAQGCKGVTRKIHLNAWFLSETATISTTDLKPQPTFDLNTDASVLYQHAAITGGKLSGSTKQMSGDRFDMIWRYLHLEDNLDPALDKSDKLWKIRRFMDLLLHQFQALYEVNGFVSVDESMRESLCVKKRLYLLGDASQPRAPS